MNDATTTIPTVGEDLSEAVRNSAMLADITISVWSGTRLDKRVTEQVRVGNNAVGKAGRYTKNLFAGCDEKLKAVQGAYHAARTLHYESTLPWSHNQRQSGPRLLSNIMFLDYIKNMTRLKKQAEALLETFLGAYPTLTVLAQANLGTLANPDDYPTVDEIRSAFDLDFEFTPIPQGSMFKGLPDNALRGLGKALEGRQARAAAAAQAAMWDRVKAAIGALVDRLTLDGSNEVKTFKSTTVENVRALITLLPGFNVTNDRRVSTTIDDIHLMLAGVDADSIRREDRTREHVLRQASEIADRLRNWGL